MSPGAIVRPARAAYLRGMAARLLRFVMLLAVMLMPVRMAAEAHVPNAGGDMVPMAAMAEHCADPAPTPDDRTNAKIDCMMACAALPAAGEPLARRLRPDMTERPTPDRRAVAASYGADPPPPRMS